MIFEYQPFDMKSQLYIEENDRMIKLDVPNDYVSIAQAIVQGSHNYDNYKVVVKAPQWFFDEICPHVEKVEQQHYCVKKIEMERV